MFRVLVSDAVHSLTKGNKGKTRLSPAQAWGIAAGANLAALRFDSLDTLDTGKSRANAEYTLREWWGVKDAKSLREMVQWLTNAGHSAEFIQVYNMLSDLNEEQYAALLQLQANPTARNRMEIVWAYRNEADRALKSWDLGRMINIVRAGYGAGYIDEAEAWQHIMDAARRLQPIFGSWKELSDNYMLGREFWGVQTGTDDVLMERATWLLIDPASPWQKLAWNTPLG
jgi:hypothetical protein